MLALAERKVSEKLRYIDAIIVRFLRFLNETTFMTYMGTFGLHEVRAQNV